LRLDGNCRILVAMNFVQTRLMRGELWLIVIFTLGPNLGNSGSLSSSQLSAILPSAALAQGARTTPRKIATRPWSRQECAQGVELRLTSLEPIQGSLQLVEIRSANQLAQVIGRWGGNEIPFWRSDSAGKSNSDVRRAFLGIDLEHAGGKTDFVVSAKRLEGESFSCTVSLDVKEGRFATETLKVAPQFVEPNPEQIARADEERKRLRELFATVTPEKLWNGKFRIPITGATTGGNFGKRRVLNGQPSSPHSGVDFAAPAGTPVHAAQSGRVVLAEPLYFSGNTVIVDHGLGVYTFYGHLRSIDVKAGDAVNVGALLGKVGATGRATGPHLHWGLTVNRARVNSLDIVKLL
jgi:murein DD-endopeptidase MepM/ murein hydrolase activator NlpD